MTEVHSDFTISPRVGPGTKLIGTDYAVIDEIQGKYGVVNHLSAV